MEFKNYLKAVSCLIAFLFAKQTMSVDLCRLVGESYASPAGLFPQSVAFSPDGSYVATANGG